MRGLEHNRAIMDCDGKTLYNDEEETSCITK